MDHKEPRAIPRSTKGRFSVVRLSRYWYPVCASTDLEEKPLARRLLGTPIVVFRGAGGKASALLDRCPHRNVPLSLGRVREGDLECPYHGWRFQPGGRCTRVPGLLEQEFKPAQNATAYETCEQDGLVWVYAELNKTPAQLPFRLPRFDDARYVTVQREVEAEATLHATLENALDVPHTAFLHRKLFRGGTPNRITASVVRSHDRVEIAYSGEPTPSGWVARLLGAKNGVVEHWDRFILPSIAQVEYRLGKENHILVTAVGLPISDFHTRLFATASLCSRLPVRLVRPLLEPLALRIFAQDQNVLKAQADAVRAFGGEQFVSTPLDLMGPHMWRLMRQAERGGTLDREGKVVEQSVDFLA